MDTITFIICEPPLSHVETRIYDLQMKHSVYYNWDERPTFLNCHLASSLASETLSTLMPGMKCRSLSHCRRRCSRKDLNLTGLVVPGPYRLGVLIILLLSHDPDRFHLRYARLWLAGSCGRSPWGPWAGA